MILPKIHIRKDEVLVWCEHCKEEMEVVYICPDNVKVLKCDHFHGDLPNPYLRGPGIGSKRN